jgi:hypothetical protein
MQSVVTEGQHAAAAGIHHLLSADPHLSMQYWTLYPRLSPCYIHHLFSQIHGRRMHASISEITAQKILLKFTQECPACLRCTVVTTICVGIEILLSY